MLECSHDYRSYFFLFNPKGNPLTLSEGGRSFPSFFQVTVGVGAPDIGISSFRGSPALTLTSLPPNFERSTLGGAKNPFSAIYEFTN